MYCKNCGNKLSPGVNFCSECGEKTDIINEEKSIRRNTANKLKIIIPISIISLIAIMFLSYTLFLKTQPANNDKTVESTLSSPEKNTAAKNQPVEQVRANISINQIDSSNFPEIKIYFTPANEAGQLIKDFNVNDLKIKENNNLQTTALQLKELSKDESLNINLVMDTSASMNNGKIDTAKKAALEFLNSVNFQENHLVEVISFNDLVSINQFFTKDKSSLANSISSLPLNGQTALYDALNTSLVETSRQSGAKCVIAFTDGQDNKSSTTPEQVVDLSRKLSIPIYIVGIGDQVQNDILTNLSERTGGYFISINDIYKLKDIYEEIFNKQKEQYVLSFNTANTDRDNKFRNLSLELGSKYLGTGESSYVPKYLIDPTINPNNGYSQDYKLSDIEKSIYNYQYSFVKAVDNGDFNHWAPYIDRNSSLFKQQSDLIDSYKSQGIKLKLLFFSIDSIRKINDNQYEMVVFEKFYITYRDRKPSYKDYKNTYTVTKVNGEFKVSELSDIQTISDITVNY